MSDRKNKLPKNSNIKIQESDDKSPMFPYQDEAIENLENGKNSYTFVKSSGFVLITCSFFMPEKMYRLYLPFPALKALLWVNMPILP